MVDVTSAIDGARMNLVSDKETRMKRSAESAKFEHTLDNAIKSGSKKKPVDKKLMDACVEMESIFVNKMLKEMRKNVQKGDWLHGGHAEEIFEDMLYDQYSLSISKNSKLGIADMMYKELSRRA